MHKGKHGRRLLIQGSVLFIGIAVMSLGIAFSIKSDLGTSPVSSVPYVATCISGLSVGITTIIINIIFIVLQIIILRKRYRPYQLLQLPISFVMGFMIDLSEFCIRYISYSSYMHQWTLCIIGIFLIAFGVSISVRARLVPAAGEGLVLAICEKLPIKFGNMKVIFDVSLVCISIVMGIVFLENIEGVGEGTLAAAICVGLLTKQFKKILAPGKRKKAQKKRKNLFDL